MIGLLICLRRFEPRVMRQTSNAFACLFLLLLATTPGNAGVGIITGIGITTSQVNTYHYMEADSTTAYYYDVAVDGFIFRDSGPGTSYSQIKSGSAGGGAWAEKELSNSKTNNRGYIAQSNYWLIAYFYYYVNSTIVYEDWLGYGLINPGGYGGNGTINAPGGYNTLGYDEIYIGTAYIGDNTYLPSISAIVVTGSPVRGGSGYIEVYGTNLAKWAGPTTASISGSGVTASVIYQNYLNPGQVNLSYSISSNATTGNRNLTLTTPFGNSNSKIFTVYDASPVINSINHGHWGAGGTTIFTLWGQYFGTNPQVAVVGAGVTGYNVLYRSDGQINVDVTISPTSSDGAGLITVTSTGATGGGFQQAPGGGGPQAIVNATVLSKNSFSMKLEKIGFAINTSSNLAVKYGEETTIRVTAVRNANGAALLGWTGTVPIRETTSPTLIYTQNGGSLPSSVDIPYGISGDATTTFVARSFAQGVQVSVDPAPRSYDPPDPAEISTTVASGSSGFNVYQQSYLSVPQWVVSGATIDTRICAPSSQTYDWFQHMMKDIWNAADADSTAMLNTVQCYMADNLPGAQGTTPVVFRPRSPTSPITISPYLPEHRRDDPEQGSCGATVTNGLKSTLLHEARHAYQLARATATNDADNDIMVNAPYPIAPANIMVDSSTFRNACGSSINFQGDGTRDYTAQFGKILQAMQADAIGFSDLHDE